MGNIVLLDELTINKIAAGEVIERPASAIKEMVENSIDAGANNITVEIKNGGISYIRITDNGKGIKEDDLELAFERHATSKIRSADDLNKIKSMGFRGEALASIAAISRVELTSKTVDQLTGNQIVVEGGKILEKTPVGSAVGTTIIVTNLFYNTPVRYKFLRKDFTESGYIEDVISRIALAHPEIAIKLINSGKTVIQTNGNGDLKTVIYSLYGRDVANSIIDVDYYENDIHIYGVVGKPEIARSNRSNQVFFINKRYVKDKTLASAAERAYKDLIPNGKFGFLVLNLDMNPSKVDVNVHPAKLEVRFENESIIFKALYNAIKKQLSVVEDKKKNSRDSFFDNRRSEETIVEQIYRQRQAQSLGLNYISSTTQAKPTNEVEKVVPSYETVNKQPEYQPEVKKEISEENNEKKENSEFEKIPQLTGDETLDKSQEVLRKLQELKNKMLQECKENGTPISENTINKEPKHQYIEETKIEEPRHQFVEETKVEEPKHQFVEEAKVEEPRHQFVEEAKVEEPKHQFVEEAKVEGPKHQFVEEEKVEEPKHQFVEEAKVEEPKYQFVEETKTEDPKYQYDEKSQNEEMNKPEISNNGLSEKESEYKSEYSPEFEEMYMRFFGTKPGSKQEKVEQEKKQEQEKEAFDQLVKPVENISIFDDKNDKKVPLYKFIGIAFDDYAILEIDKEMCIINLREAQERVLFEVIKDDYYDSHQVSSQLLLLPDVITLSRKEMEIAKDNREMFKKAGFVFEEFGENTIKLTQVPEICAELETNLLFLEILEEINSVARTAKREIEEKFLQIIAKKAVDELKRVTTKEEIESLMEKVLILDNPFVAADGTTYAIKMSKYDIERKFARK